jgi:hypothetical protein
MGNSEDNAYSQEFVDGVIRDVMEWKKNRYKNPRIEGKQRTLQNNNNQNAGNSLSTRVVPSGSYCGYSQSTGNLTCTNNATSQQLLSCRGYSGRGAGLNNPAAQNQLNIGPIPRGDYTVGAPNNRRGPVTRPLTPNPNNNMFGRSGFLMHGDNSNQNNTASKGCIVTGPNCRSRIPNGAILRVVQ